MKLKLDDNHCITSDTRNIILGQPKKIKDKKTGEEKEIVEAFGYYRTIEQALYAYIDLRIRKSEAETIKQLADEIVKTKEIVINFTRDFRKHLKIEI